MFYVSWLSRRLVSIALVGIIASLVSCAHRRPDEHPVEVAVISGPEFPIRVSAFAELDGGFVPGRYYRFESMPDGSKSWVTAMQFRHDDPVPIPGQNVRFLTSHTAFVFMGWKYAVTTDGGRQWNVWNAEKDLTGWHCCNYVLIKDVALTKNGNGKMFLSPIEGRAGEVPELVTSDFGRHWSPPGSHN
jgi:hypothetical protein